VSSVITTPGGVAGRGERHCRPKRNLVEIRTPSPTFVRSLSDDARSSAGRKVGGTARREGERIWVMGGAPRGIDR
jgi:hypothetical protein